MSRPTIPDDEKHERSFRVRLQDNDANLLIALSKKAGIPPAVMLRSLIRKQLPTYQLMSKLGMSVKDDLTV